MARPQSQAIAGYYPTPQHLLPAIASTIAVPKDEPRSRFLFLDPCAGTGEALLKLAAAVLDYDLEDAARSCLGIELETERAKALRDRLPQGSAHHGDALTFGFAGDGATVLFLNPPYDTDPDYRRSEHRFLVRFTETLAPGGILVFVVPCATLSACADHLAAHYTHLHLWRFPDPDFVAFRQCVLVGLRREVPVPPGAGLLEVLHRSASDPSTMPILASLPRPAVTARTSDNYLTLSPQSIDLPELLRTVRPFEATAQALGYDRDVDALLGGPLPVALPPQPAHIALALAAGLLNGRPLRAQKPTLPDLLAKGTFRKAYVTVEERHNRKGEVTGEVQVQQPRLDIHVLRLDTLAFQRIQLGTEPSGATSLDAFNTADLLEHYGGSLAKLVHEQLPALHDPAKSEHRIALPVLGRRPFHRQAQLIQAGLKLLALGENPQLLAEVGTGKSTVALSIAGALAPAHFAHTCAELEDQGYSTQGLRPVRRILILCPPHLLKSWTDQSNAVLPEASVVLVQTPSDLEREAAIYVLSRETAKLGSTVAGVAAGRCPHCGHPTPPGTASTFAAERMRCSGTWLLPTNAYARLAVTLGLALYRALPIDTLKSLRAYLEPHPAASRRASDSVVLGPGGEPLSPLSPQALAVLDQASAVLLDLAREAIREGSWWAPHFRTPLLAGSQIALLFERVEAFTAQCKALLVHRPQDSVDSGVSRTVERNAEEALEKAALLATHTDPNSARRDCLATLVAELLAAATWEEVSGCGEPLYSATAEPRRVPLARYILRKKREMFDLLILDEVHEFSTSGSAQQKAAHRLVTLPGVPTIALTGSLMGGYASSLFANAWALSRRFRKQFELDDRGAFVSRYGYRKVLVERSPTNPASARHFGRTTDRTEEDAPLVRQLGEAPGILPLYVLEHILPTGLIMHKADLENELPPCTEEPIAVSPGSDPLDPALLAEYHRLRQELVRQIQADRGTDRAGLLWGAMSELPSYLDLANEECGEFRIAYPEEAGGEVIATGRAFQASWRSPKERWLLETVAGELAEDRRVLIFLRHTGNGGYLRRLHRLLFEELGEKPTFLDPAKVPTGKREAWLDEAIAGGCRVLLVHPKAVQTGLNNLTAFATALWYEGPDYDARVTRQANGRPHRIGQTLPVRLLYPYYSGTLQKTALDLVARKITASLQVDGLSLAGALEAAGALSEEDRQHATAALAFGQALYRAATTHS